MARAKSGQIARIQDEQAAGLHRRWAEIIRQIGDGSLHVDTVLREFQRIIESGSQRPAARAELFEVLQEIQIPALPAYSADTGILSWGDFAESKILVWLAPLFGKDRMYVYNPCAKWSKVFVRDFVGYRDGDYNREVIPPLQEKATGPITLKAYQIPSPGPSIDETVSAFGGEARCEVLLKHVEWLMKKQRHGNRGLLATDERTNVALVRNNKGILQAVGCLYETTLFGKRWKLEEPGDPTLFSRAHILIAP